MCGIAGLVERPGEAPPRRTLESMGAAMAHRGPDEGTQSLHGRAGFSFRRLAIIDVAGGRQPLSNEDGTCHVILNGEIYNYQEIRGELLGRGHRFRTGSDVEVVVHGYEEWGDAIVGRLRGMFALALWDEPRQRLLLARDRFGKKPLVYCARDGRLAFASELRALLADARVPREADLPAIHHYLTLQYVPAPLTGFQGIHKLPPGHTLVFEGGRASVAPYWKLSFQPQLRISLPDAAAELRRLLADAVKVRLMSEVPLGAFLSGGIDSSAVVALMAESGRVKTFSIGFEEGDFDELPWARQVAQRYGTDHHEFVVRPDAADVLPRLVEHYGEPYADSSALPTYYLARMTRQHVTVALNGDGGDELFGGYDRYRLLPAYAALGRVPGLGGLGRRLAGALDGRIPVRPRRFLEALSRRPEESYGRTISYFTPEQKRAMYSDAMREAVGALDTYALLDERYAASDAPDLVARTLDVDVGTYLPGDLLVKVDIATMAVGLEGRSPLLDQHLAEFAARLPTDLKVGPGGGKRVLREAVRDLLPPGILTRRKKGFGVPVARWLRGGLRGMLEDALFSGRARTRPFFRDGAVRVLFDEHVAGRDRSNQLWALLMLELWCRRFLDPA